MYVANFDYGGNVGVFVEISELSNYIREKVTILPQSYMAPGHFSIIHLYPQDDPVTLEYNKWDPTLGTILQHHLTDIVDELLETLEIFIQNKRNRDRHSARSRHSSHNHHSSNRSRNPRR
jgi:hypothetical protein